MTTTTLYGDTQLQAALALVGGTTLGDLRNDLLKQAIVAAANRTGGGGGTGDVVGPALSTDGAVALWSGITGKLLQDSSIFITGGGTVALGGFTLTVPADGTAALLGTVNTFTKPNNFASGVITTSQPAINISQTWNNGAVGFQVITADITTVAADFSGTNLMNLKVNGTTRFRMNHGGTTFFGADNAGSSTLCVDTNNVFVSLRNGAYLDWLGDTQLRRKAAATLQMGADAAGVTNQMFTAASRITSDGVGADLTIAAGNGRGGAGGSLIFSRYSTAGAGVVGTLTEAMRITTTGAIILAALPTSDPGVPGQLYKIAGAVMQSP